MDYIDNPANVSAAQREAVIHPGSFFLTACPGSGKTRTVGVRLAYWAVKEDEDLGRIRRIAATSYTNTAIREIRSASEAAGQPVADPNFVGTLHRFLLRYVVRPFGRPVMGADHEPKLVVNVDSRGFQSEQLDFKVGFSNPVSISVWDFEWRSAGHLSLRELPFALRGKVELAEVEAKLQQRAKKAKLMLAERGLMSMSDALYWAMRTLEDVDVARIVAARFDELIVDEAQDTGDLQQACLRSLHQAGLRSLVFVGDMQQAIYGFAHADPIELGKLIGETTIDTLELRENWRSSQALCDVSHRFSDRAEPDEAVGPHRHAAFPPELILYPEDDEQAAVALFKDRLATVDIDPRDALVLCRWTATTDRLAGAQEVKLGRALRTMVEGAAAARGSGPIDRDTIQDVERLVMSLAVPDSELDTMDPRDRLELRLAVLQMLDSLPEFSIACKAWAKQARELLVPLLAQLAEEPTAPGKRVKTPTGAGDLTLEQVAGGPVQAPEVRTIHSVKGESHLATLLIAVDSSHGPANWTSWLGGHEPEEVRIAYVALTRAQRYGALALPASCPTEITDAYVEMGFVLP